MSNPYYVAKKKLNTTELLEQEISQNPCNICNYKESCETSCINFTRYVDSNSPIVRKRNYEDFKKIQRLANGNH